MNRHSILFKLNILFVVALMATVVAAFSIILHVAKKDQADLKFKSRLIVKEAREYNSKPLQLLDELNLLEIEGKLKREILEKGNLRIGDQAHRHPIRNISDRKSSIIDYKGFLYLYIHTQEIDMLLQDKQTFQQRFALPLLIFLSIIVLLIAMYILLRKSLTPIRHLQQDIVDYGLGNFPKYTISTKKDEISLVSNAFYDAITKSKSLMDSRKLFIRNIFHELNTPVTKGKILAEVVEEESTKKMLDSIFLRLSTLLRELAQIEKITSGDYTLEIGPVRVIELIDQARDLLYLDESIESNITNETIEVDFSSMSIVFKNLIDNALKYGNNFTIIMGDDTIAFVSDGDKLEQGFHYYAQAFSKGVHTGNEKGFGLGLYIVNEIVMKHAFGLTYEHNNGKNSFILHLKITHRKK